MIPINFTRLSLIERRFNPPWLERPIYTVETRCGCEQNEPPRLAPSDPSGTMLHALQVQSRAAARADEDSVRIRTRKVPLLPT